MDTHKKSFVLANNRMDFITERDCRRADNMIEAAKTICQVLPRHGYILDFFNDCIAFASDSLGALLGISCREIEEMGYDFYDKYILPQDVEMIEDFRRETCNMFMSHPTLRGELYRLDSHIHLLTPRGYRLFHHTSFPLLWSESGYVMAVTCRLAPSTSKVSGGASLFLPAQNKLYKYTAGQHKWQHTILPTLTQKEKDLVRLSAQGLIADEIAGAMGKSTESIKLYKKGLFKKLGVRNMPAAITYVFNHNLL